jgi:hypothetical protein
MILVLNTEEKIFCKFLEFISKEIKITLYDGNIRYVDRVDVEYITEEENMNFHECSECNCRCNCTTSKCSCSCREEDYTDVLDMGQITSKKESKNSYPSSDFEQGDKCPSCGNSCNIHTDLDDNDECNDCRAIK